MTNDTLKSLGYLKKSLKMCKRAIEKNEIEPGVAVGPDISGFINHVNAALTQIEAWEKLAVPVNVPAGIVQPTPAAANVSTVDDADADLLTAP